MKRRSMMLAAFFITVGIATAIAGMPGPDADALWKHMTQENPYTEWSYWPDHTGMRDGMAPHGAKHRVFVNSKALWSESAPLKYGAIVAKENYNAEGKLMAITVMYKIKGYNPEAGDWFWAKFSPDGSVGNSGKPGGCIGCHSQRADNDYILVHDF